MIFFGQQKINQSKESKIYLECECGTHLMQIVSFDDDPDIYINFYTDNFYAQQKENIFKRMWNKLKHIWYIITNKQYVFEEIVVQKKDIDKLVNALQKIETQEVK